MLRTTPQIQTPAQVRLTVRAPTPQARLEVGAPDDAYEREADQVADRVMRMAAPGASLGAMGIQRKCATCTEEDESVQRQEAGPVTAGAQQAHDNRGSGAPLPAAARGFFEPRMGVDLGAVRVHTDGRADAAARAMGAHAYTHGADIVFRGGRYAPDSSEGRRLLAHELTHVVQQGAAPRREPS